MFPDQGHIVKVWSFVYWAKHNQHVWHVNARGSGGMPFRNFLEINALRLNLREFWSIMYINFKSQNINEIKTSAINIIWRTEGEQIMILKLIGTIYACILSLVRH